MSRRVGIAVAFVVGIAGGLPVGCGEAKPPPAPEVNTLIASPAVSAQKQLEAVGETLRAENWTNGWRCGHEMAWSAGLYQARHETPNAFRSSTMGTNWLVYGAVFMVGLLGTLALALWRRKRRRSGLPQAVSLLARVFPIAHVGSETSSALVVSARVIERHLQEALSLLPVPQPAGPVNLGQPVPGASPTDASSGLGPEGTQAQTTSDTPPDDSLRAAIVTWRDHVALWRSRLADDEAPHRLIADVDRALRSQQLQAERLHADLLAGAGRPVDRALEERVGDVSSLPPLRNEEIAGWVRPVGVVGTVGLVLMLPIAAGWLAAGALPFTLVLAIGVPSLAAVVTARLMLRRQGPLFFGGTERVARAIQWVGVIALATVCASQSASVEGGFNLGSAPVLGEPTAADQVVPPPPPLSIVPEGVLSLLPKPEPEPTPDLPSAVGPGEEPLPSAPPSAVEPTGEPADAGTRAEEAVDE